MVDLHMHLDGSLPLATVRKLLGSGSLESLAQRCKVASDCRDLNQYLEKFELPLTLLQDRDSLTLATYDIVEELTKQGLTYAEIRFAPQLHRRKGLTQWEVAMAVFEGARRAKDKIPSCTRVRFIFCLMRGGEKDANMETVDLAGMLKSHSDEFFAGIDLAGAEALYPTTMYEEEIAFARRQNLPITIHAGEAAGPESIEAALDFGARRIGHGIAAIRSNSLMERLAREKIVLELCPSSNLQTKAVASLAEYPLRAFMKAGIICTINTDNMTVSDTTIAKEFQLLRNSYGLTREEEEILLANAANSFLS